MTEHEAEDWIIDRFGKSAHERLACFAASVTRENLRQNLISRSSIPSIWARHIVDSAQLIGLAPADGMWIDIGTGGGFPGMVIAILRPAPILLVEPRRQRATFLQSAASELGLPLAKVVQAKIGAVREAAASVISARAVASLDRLLHDSRSVTDRDTVFILPRGRSAEDELSTIRGSWRGVFHVEQSITDASAAIVVARNVRPS